MSSPVPDLVISRESFVWGYSPEMAPVGRVSPGALVRFETNDCYQGQVRSEADTFETIDRDRVNAATGPLFVEGAEPGDTLAVELLQVVPGPQGAAMILPGTGQLTRHVKAPTTRILQVRDGLVHLNDEVTFPARPMVGVIGIAPEQGYVPSLSAGQHGGNLDESLNGPGATVLLPVRQTGALLAIGDMHAAMGDGEVSGTGVEIDGDVLVRVSLLKARQTGWPVTELADAWVTHGTADADLPLAIEIACEEAARLLVDEWGFTMEDAFIFLSVACDVGIAQACHPCPGTVIARVRVPRIGACPAPFRERTAR